MVNKKLISEIATNTRMSEDFVLRTLEKLKFLNLIEVKDNKEVKTKRI